MSSTARPGASRRIARGHDAGARRVEVGGRLVQDQQRRVAQERPGERDPPDLARGERSTAVSDPRVVGGAELPDELVGAREPRGLLDPGVRCVGIGHRDVVSNAASEQGRTLGQPADLPPPGRRVDVAEVVPVDRDHPGVRAAKPEQQRGHGALTGPARADERDDLAAADLEVEPVEERARPPGIAERHVPEGHDVPRARRRARSVSGWRHRVEQVEDALGGREPVRARVELRGQRPERRVQLGRQQQNGQRRAQAHVAADQAHAERHGDERRGERRHQLERGSRQERHAQDLHRRHFGRPRSWPRSARPAPAPD